MGTNYLTFTLFFIQYTHAESHHYQNCLTDCHTIHPILYPHIDLQMFYLQIVLPVGHLVSC